MGFDGTSRYLVYEPSRSNGVYVRPPASYSRSRLNTSRPPTPRLLRLRKMRTLALWSTCSASVPEVK